MKESTIVSDKKAVSRQRLLDRYHGKRDILWTWEQKSDMADSKYIRDLARRIRGHQLDLAYRGADGFTELVGQ